jgi:hypothetical protein
MRCLTRTSLMLAVLATPLASQEVTYTPSRKPPNGREIVAIYLGAQTCGPCLFPEVKEAVIRMKGLVQAQARKAGASFATIGASSDWDQSIAATFLAAVGPFDQVVLGSNWTNLAFEHFVWRDPKGSSVMPQILIIERTVTPAERITFSEPRILRRILGGKDIPAWVAQGAPISLATSP